MRITDVIITEAYIDELLTAISDLLAAIMARDITRVNTEKLRVKLAKQGYVTSMDELIQAIDQSGYASSVDANEVVLSNSLPDDMTDEEEPIDVGQMAGDQALDDIKGNLR